MLAQVLAGILAWPAPIHLGLDSSRPPLRNGPTDQRNRRAPANAIPLWFMVRSDFYVAFSRTNRLHEQGCCCH
jgi:hypothetical protein